MSTLPLDPEAAQARPERPVRLTLVRLAESLAAAAHRTRERGDDEAIHDLRVAIRRLAAALSLWRAVLEDRARRRAIRRLRRLRRVLGRARELEVHVADLERRTSEQPFVLRLLLQELLDDLRKRRERARRRASGRVTERRERRIVQSVRRASRTADAEPVASAAAAAGGLTRAAQRARVLMAAARNRGDAAALHTARIATKKWRYAIEAHEAAFGRAPGPPAETLRSVQKALGEAQDRVTLRARLEDHAARLRARGLEAQAQALGPLFAEVESERRRAVERFEALEPAIGSVTELRGATLPAEPA